jgi:hypothetical protein
MFPQICAEQVAATVSLHKFRNGTLEGVPKPQSSQPEASALKLRISWDPKSEA